MRELQVGDIVEVVWADHYAYKGDRPNQMLVRTFGKIDAIIKEQDPTKDGLALVLNEAQGDEKYAQPRYERIMDGQFILSATIKSIHVLRKEEEGKL